MIWALASIMSCLRESSRTISKIVSQLPFHFPLFSHWHLTLEASSLGSKVSLRFCLGMISSLMSFPLFLVFSLLFIALISVLPFPVILPFRISATQNDEETLQYVYMTIVICECAMLLVCMSVWEGMTITLSVGRASLKEVRRDYFSLCHGLSR